MKIAKLFEGRNKNVLKTIKEFLLTINPVQIKASGWDITKANKMKLTKVLEC